MSACGAKRRSIDRRIGKRHDMGNHRKQRVACRPLICTTAISTAAGACHALFEAMPRFHFNIRQNEILFEDKRGAELPDLRAAWAWALEDARTLLRQDMVTAPMERLWVEIADESGAAVASVPFGRTQLH